MTQAFEQLLDVFIPHLQKKDRQVNQATWILETTGSQDAAQLKAELETEFQLLFHDKEIFDRLQLWQTNEDFQDPILKRQLNVLIRMFKAHLIDKELLKEIAEEKAKLSLVYSNFRPQIGGKTVSDNEIREILKHEDRAELRKEAWNASKQIGQHTSSHILKLVGLRNQAAERLGYSNYFSMQLELQEVDEKRLFNTLDHLATDSESAYVSVVNDIHASAAKRFHVSKEAIGPWAWSEPFCQEDPIDAQALDELAKNTDILQAVKFFYQQMGLDVEKVIERSDNFERSGKNPNAFCINLDRQNDIRTLNNIKPTIKWLETILHELGHAVYEKGFSPELPWLLREPPHMITTEAMALLAGRQAYRSKSLDVLIGGSMQSLKERAEESLKRRQLIFSRWVLVMTYFERELYRNPDQDLNQLWWKLVEKYQKIHSHGSSIQLDWAAKYHIGMAPVYYFSYLLGELLASTLEREITIFSSSKTGMLLNEKLFKPGNSMRWNELITHATGRELSPHAWLLQFGSPLPSVN